MITDQEACDCPWCIRHRRYKRLLRKYKFKPNDIIFLKNLYSDLNHAEDHLEYNNAILDGSWPSSVEQLTFALKHAKKVREVAE